MTEKSISAYNNAERAKRYDADMDLWHPNRHKMVDVAIGVLPYGKWDHLSVLDLGIGTGFFTWRFLQHYPEATVIGVDGSEAMIHIAKSRLEKFSSKIQYINVGFANIENEISNDIEFDVVISMYSLHHLDVKRKKQLFSFIVSRLRVGGWFLNADVIISPFSDIENRIQEVRINDIKERNKGSDPRFTTSAKIRAFIDQLAKNENDNLLTLDQDLAIMREAGISNATVFWQEYREVVYGGTKTSS